MVRKVSYVGSSVCLLSVFEMLVMVDVNDNAMQPSRKMGHVVEVGDGFCNGCSGGFGCSPQA